jgi:Opacity family porin protein
MSPTKITQIFSQLLLIGAFIPLSISHAIASEILTVEVSAVDRQSELLTDSTDDSIAKIGGIYPINTLLNPESTPATSDLALARRKKRINTKSQIKRQGSNTQPQIQNTPISTPAQDQNTPINTELQVQNPQINTPLSEPSGLTATQNQIQYKRNNLGVAVQFGNGTSFGVQGKIGVMDNISIRPEFFFSNGGDELENKEFTSSLKNVVRAPQQAVINPANLRYRTQDLLPILTDSFTTPTNITINSTFVTSVPIGAISAGTTILQGTIIPAGTVLLEGTALPVSQPIFATATNQPPLFLVPATFVGARGQGPVTLAADYIVSVPFTTSTFRAIPGIPAGTPIAKGTIIPKGTVLSGDIPTDSRTENTLLVANPSGAIKSKIKQSTSLGLAVTYDFKLDPAGKSTAYLGPKIAYTAASGDVDIPGVQTQTLNTSETKIGLVAGVDYVLFDGFTIGANANYYFSRNLSGSITSPTGVSIPFQSVGSGSSTDFGLRIGYQF